MNVTTEQVRETFDLVARTTPVPPFDEMGFGRRVRRRRQRNRVVAGTGVAAAVAAVAISVGMLAAPFESDRVGDRSAVASSPGAAEGATTTPLYVVAGDRLVAVLPSGQMRELGVSAEAVLGWSSDTVVAVDRASRVVEVSVSWSGDSGRFEHQGPRPLLEGGVQSVALSADGRWLAWVDLEERVMVRDLRSGSSQTYEVGANSYVSSVSERGVLVSQDGDLVLLDGRRQIPVPTERDGYGWVSDVAGDFVSVADRDDVTRVYDVAGGEADLLAEVPGTGRLAPDGESVVTAAQDGEAWLWTAPGEASALEGVQGVPESVGWLGARQAIVTSRVEGGTAIQVCRVSSGTCDLSVISEREVRLAE